MKLNKAIKKFIAILSALAIVVTSVTISNISVKADAAHPDIYLTGDPNEPVDPKDPSLGNKSSLVMKKPLTVRGVTVGAQYKYVGFATTREATSDYKYLILTCAGDISTLRFEFCVPDGQGGNKELIGPYWFNKACLLYTSPSPRDS